MRFGDTLKNLLEERELSQKQLAAELNLLPPTLGRYIRNEREPDIETIRTIAKYFGVSADYLLDVQSEKIYAQNENELLRIFRSLDFEQQELYIEQGKVFIRLNNRQKEKQKLS